ncbi:MAG: NAD-dependent epimerase/dehydratase family protein, partial [Proteobacteria bacterium]|nr:NAD-dependent epimerase/dehydratase family protein [Pseudomonadota bacterium]NDG26690.1 NAD-dependent epimerase/dehydratase family protein [Pseudomonadota bacterium]
GFPVTGLDIADAQEPLLHLLQKERLDYLRSFQGFRFVKCDVRDVNLLENVFGSFEFSQVAHLAARTGVRDSFEKPQEYWSVNVEGTRQLVRLSKEKQVGHFLFASSSSVYGEGQGISNEQSPLGPISPYGETKMEMEKIVASFADQQFRTTGVRPFSVYGPWGRPDMAYFKYAKKISEGSPIELFNFGEHLRDFTFVDDVVEGIFRLILAHRDGHTSYQSAIYNLGRGKPERLTDLVKYLETALGVKAQIQKIEKQAGDVGLTWSDTSGFEKDFHFKPHTSLKEGIDRFAEWWLETFKKPVISIQMVVKNGEKFIASAIMSALNQTFQDFELIIVDDGSTDNTQGEIGRFKDSRIKLLVNPRPGLSRARQLALCESRGQWSAIFDADDISHLERLSQCLKAVKPGIVLVGGQMEEMNEEGEVISRCSLYPKEMDEIRKRLGRSYSVCHGASLFNTDLARSVGGYDEEKGLGEDEDLFVRLAQRGTFCNLDDFLIQRRIHRKSVCTDDQIKRALLWKKMFSAQSLELSTYWSRLGKSALRGDNPRMALSYFYRSLQSCPLKLNSWWGGLTAIIHYLRVLSQ